MCLPFPGRPAVRGEVQAAVTTEYEMAGVSRVDPQGVVILVNAGGAIVAEGPADVR